MGNRTHKLNWRSPLSITLIIAAVFCLSGCNPPADTVDTTTPEYTLTTLLDGISEGRVNEVAPLYCTNPEMLTVDEANDPDNAAVTQALYKTLTYKIGEVNNGGHTCTISLTMTTADFAAAAEAALEDPAYTSLTEEEQDLRYNDFLINHIIEDNLAGTTLSNQYTVTLEKHGDSWQLLVDEDLAKALKGVSF